MFRSLGQPERAHHARSQRVRPLRPQHRRRRGGGAGGHRRPGGHAGLRGREALRPDRALGAARSARTCRPSATSWSPRPTAAQVPLGQIAQIVEEEGPSLDLSARTLRRYTPVKFSVRGRDLASTIAEAQDKIDSEGQAALRHAPRVGGRDQPAQRGDRPPGDHHPAHAAADRVPRLLVGEELEGHAHRAGRHPGRVRGRRAGACSSPRTHFSISAAMGFISIFGIADPGRAHRRAPTRSGCGTKGAASRRARARRRARPAPGADDDVRRDDRPSAGGALARHRLGDAEAARHRRHRRRAHAGHPAAPAPAGAAGALAPSRKARRAGKRRTAACLK